MVPPGVHPTFTNSNASFRVPHFRSACEGDANVSVNATWRPDPNATSATPVATPRAKCAGVQLRDVEVLVVANPPPSFGGRYFTLVKVTASNGIVGWGEAYAASVGPRAMTAVIEDVFHRHAAGLSPFDVERLFRRCHSAGFLQRPDPTVMGAFSAIETAAYDIAGKALEQPVHRLIGGRVNERLRAYTYLYPTPAQDPATFYNDADAAAVAAAAWVEEGFTAVKFDPAGAYTVNDPHMPAQRDLARSDAFCARVREAVGERADILFGTHGQFTPGGALRMARRIAAHDPLWFEEPVPPDSWGSLREICRTSPVPVATGERLATAYEFAAALECGVAIVQPALGRAGGISQGRKIAALAEVRHAQVAPHLYCGPVEALANIQLAAALPNLLVVEMIGRMDGFHAELLDRPIRLEGGHVVASERPGLGHKVDEAVARANPWPGPGGDERLHLEMQDEPIDYGGETRFAGG